MHSLSRSSPRRWSGHTVQVSLAWILVAAAGPWASAQVFNPGAEGRVAPNVTDQIDDASGGPSVDELVTTLGHDSFEERERASELLVNCPDADDDSLARLVREGAASPEQRLRLINVLRERFLRSPRGAIGIQFANNTQGARIDSVRPDFPAGRLGLLRSGDLIVEVDGLPLLAEANAAAAAPAPPPGILNIQGQGLVANNVNLRLGLDDGRDRLIQHVVSRRPGDVVTLEVERPIPAGDQRANPDGSVPVERVEVRVPLGSFEDLHPDPGIRGRAYARAWIRRASDLGLTVLDQPVMASAIEHEAWLIARRSQRGAMNDGETWSAGRSPGRYESFRAQSANRVVVGGNPKERAAAQAAGLAPEPVPVRIVRIEGPDEGLDAGLDSLGQNSAAEMREELALLAQSLQQLRRNATLPGLPQNQRRLIEAEIEQHQIVIRELQSRLQQMAEAEPRP